MQLDTFAIILSRLPMEVRIDFSGYVEPFFNPVCGKMLELAVKSGREVHVYTTLMGMTEDDFRTLKQFSPHFIKIHSPDKTGLKLNSKVWLKQFSRLIETGLKFDTMTMGELEPCVQEFMTLHGIQIEVPQMISRGGNLWSPARIDGPLYCSENRWHQNVVLPDGSVYACCMDYGLTMPIGNILTEDYLVIFDRAEELAKNTNPPADSICRTCEWARPLPLL